MYRCMCACMHSSLCVCVRLQGGKKNKGGEGLMQWESEREVVLQCLSQLLQLDIRSLWSLSLVEEEFVRSVLLIACILIRGGNSTITIVWPWDDIIGILYILRYS